LGQVKLAGVLAMNSGYLSEIKTGQKGLTMLKTFADGLSLSLSKLVDGL